MADPKLPLSLCGFFVWREMHVGDYQLVAGYACRPGDAGLLAKLLCDSVLCFAVFDMAYPKLPLSEGGLLLCVRVYFDRSVMRVTSGLAPMRNGAVQPRPMFM